VPAPPSSVGVIERLAGLVLGAYLTGIGIDGVTRGRYLYTNMLHVPMSTVFSLAAGLCVLWVFTIGWKRIDG